MTYPEQHTTDRVAQLIPSLGRENANEVVAASRAINRNLQVNGYDWHEVARRWSKCARPAAGTRFGPRPAFGDRARYLRDHTWSTLSLTEQQFVMEACRLGFNKRPSASQDEWLWRIFCRARGQAA